MVATTTTVVRREQKACVFPGFFILRFCRVAVFISRRRELDKRQELKTTCEEENAPSTDASEERLFIRNQHELSEVRSSYRVV